jgi:predicted RNase H-like nuclease (RuvC/YqgF family)
MFGRGYYECLAGQVEKLADQVEKLTDMIDTKINALDAKMDKFGRPRENLEPLVGQLYREIVKVQNKVEALDTKMDIIDEMVRTECARLYMEMADGKKRTSRLEEYTRVLDKHAADEPMHYSGGAFGMLALREQHRMQQRGSEY